MWWIYVVILVIVVLSATGHRVLLWGQPELRADLRAAALLIPLLLTLANIEPIV